MGNNRGVSGVVGTVLTVLMAIVGVGILWIAVLSYLDLDSGLNVGMVRIDTDGGYTVYDENEGIACVHVVRNDEEIDEIKILFIIQGNSHTVFINNTNIPAPNNKKVYCVNLSNYGSPTSVVVIPILDSREGPGSEYSIPHKLINPDAIEDIRDGRRGLYYVDGTMLTYYFDGDGDDYGGSEEDFEVGSQSTGYILIGGDCDDGNGSINPNASESMNNDVDEDCDGWFGLDDCYDLDVENGNYLLMKDVNFVGFGSCFTIGAEDIIFDLGGHVVTGIEYRSGISVSSVVTTMKNGSITGFTAGISGGGDGSELTISDIFAYNNGYSSDYGNAGISLGEGGIATIINSDFSNNLGKGMEFFGQEKVVILQTIIQNNQENGLYCRDSIIEISDSQIIDNTEFGIAIADLPCEIDMTNVDVCGNTNSDFSCGSGIFFGDMGGNTCAPTGMFSCGSGLINCGACS